jgi:hypothetical protein
MAKNDAAITIFGKIDSVEQLDGLLYAIEWDQCADDWIAPLFDVDDAVDHVSDAASNGKAVTLVKSDTYYHFDNLREFCVKNGVSYKMCYGDHGAEGMPELEIWKPGMDKAIELHSGGTDNDSVVTMSFLKKLLKKGPDAVSEFVKERDELLQVGPIVVDPDLFQQWLLQRDAETENEQAPKP